MNVLIKCYTENVSGNTVNVQNRRHLGASDPETGDRIFVWKLELENTRPTNTHTPGAGLAERGVLDQKPTERQNAGRYVEISLSIDVYFPQQPFNNRMLRDILDNSQASRLQLDLARKLKDHAHSGLIPLSNEEANYLDTLYDPIGIDYGNIRRDRVDETTRQRLVEARLGQGRFRYQVLEKWGQRCVVSGCAVEEILRASHIKPWRESNNDERLNPANGLLLTANLDALFDRHLISFENDGRMLVSLNISPTEREILEIPRNLRSDLVLGEQERHFLCQHRGMHEVANQRELLTSSAAERARYHAR